MKQDVEDDVLAGVDLDAWQVPPPATLHSPAFVVRALSRAAESPARRRLSWLLPAAAVLNAALAAILIIIVITRPDPEPTVTVLPAGGGDPIVQRLVEQIRKLDAEMRMHQAKLAELNKERTLLEDLRKELEQREADLEALERQVGIRRDKTVPRQPKQPNPPAPPAPAPTRPRIQDSTALEDPFTGPAPPSVGCDEVSCVLGNYVGACCAKYRKGARPTQPAPKNALPETLDRSMISIAISRVKARVVNCAQQHPVPGKVKISVRVRPTGVVDNVTVTETPDADLGACVESVVWQAKFDKTQLGGSFSYPFIF
jgi:hypothetical protein